MAENTLAEYRDTSELAPGSRVKKAAKMLDAYYGDEPISDLTDALADLRHFATAAGLDFENALRVSYNHYLEERAAHGLKTE